MYICTFLSKADYDITESESLKEQITRELQRPLAVENGGTSNFRQGGSWLWRPGGRRKRGMLI